MINTGGGFFVGFLDIIFPKRCVACGRVGTYICLSCRETVIPIAQNECICPVCEKPAIDGVTHPKCHTRHSLDGLTSFFRYRGAVRSAVQTLKYKYVSDLVKEFVGLITFSEYQTRSVAGKPHVIMTAVPLHAARLRHRGFNQADVLGREAARILCVRFVPDILRRAVATEPQVHMRNKSLRQANMKQVFAIRRREDIGDRFVLLFDDVFTTGATVREAGRVLKAAGARYVWAVTMAR